MHAKSAEDAFATRGLSIGSLYPLQYGPFSERGVKVFFTRNNNKHFSGSGKTTPLGGKTNVQMHALEYAVHCFLLTSRNRRLFKESTSNCRGEERPKTPSA